MSMEDLLVVASIIVTFLVLCSASYSDHRSREVSDVHWVLIAGVGLLVDFSILINEGSTVPAIMFLTSGSLFIASILGGFGRADLILEVISIMVAGTSIFPHPHDTFILACSMAVLFGGVYHLLYILGIVRGGADAKCLISIGFVIPCYPIPVFGSITNVPELLRLIIIPSFSVLFVASVFSVIGCGIFCILKNLGQDMDIRTCIHTYQVPLDTVDKRFVWPVERPACCGGGSCEAVDEDIPELLEQFRKEGREKIRVTPMVPFIIPLTVGFMIMVLFGSPLFIL